MIIRVPVFLVFLMGLLGNRGVAQDPIRDSVVKIHVTQRLPDFSRPWTRGSAREASGSGAIIAGNRILTNAHVVLYATRILIQANQSSERVPATVEYIAPGTDLALLKLSDESLFENRPALPLAEGLPRNRDKVSVYGFPIGGEQLSVTEGIISRVEYVTYAYGDFGLRIQVDAALNPGNSGGPAIADGNVVGLVFSGIRQAENIGYLIPADEIRMFLADIEDGQYQGKPKLLDIMQTVENSALRARLGLDPSMGGLMVTQVSCDDDAYPLRKWDVVTHIGDQAIDRQGNISVGDELRLSFYYLIPKLARDGHVALTVFREGESVPMRIPLRYDSDLVMRHLKGGYPPFFLCGPLVFTTASQELVAGMAGQMQAMFQVMFVARRNPMISRWFDRPSLPGEELVLLAPRTFSHPLCEGYGNQPFAVLSRVNDVSIKNLAHLVETIRDAKGEFISFQFGGYYETMVFNRQELLGSTDDILEDEGIRFPMSDELRPIWKSP